jgi:hypothetical protein
MLNHRDVYQDISVIFNFHLSYLLLIVFPSFVSFESFVVLILPSLSRVSPHFLHISRVCLTLVYQNLCS